MTTALVTGATGFTGRYMVDALSTAGCRVIAWGDGYTGAAESFHVDLADPNAVAAAVESAQADWVIHLAAISSVDHDDKSAFYRVNTVGTSNLLEALGASRHTPAKILIASSANVYGRPSVARIPEELCPAPVNHYACSKLAMEHVAATWFRRLPIIIARPFNYTGPGQDQRFVIPKIVEHFARDRSTVELGNIDVARDFGDVRDTVRAYLDLLAHPADSTIVNISTGRPTSLQEIIAIMTELTGKELRVQTNPAFVRRNEIPSLCGDNDRLRSLVGRVPDTPIRETLKSMYRFTEANP